MSRRTRSDAIWSRLTPEQQQRIHHWLHEERLTYRETHRRVREELGLDCSRATVARFYQHGLKYQASDEVADGQSAARQIAAAGADLKDLRSSSLQVIATRLLEKSMDHAEVKDIAALGRIILEAEQREIQRERTVLARERFEFKASKAALEALSLSERLSREELDREQQRIEQIKQTLFGKEKEELKK